MAWTQGGAIGSSEVSNWYTTLNKTIESYGGGIAQLSNPIGVGRDVYASDLNNLTTKLDELKRDEYLSDASYGSYSTVSKGQIIKATDWTGINSSISSLSGVKCRNKATYTNGTCSNGANGNGTKENGSKHNGTDGHGPQHHFNNTCINVGESNGTKSNVNYNHGSNSNQQKVDIWNTNTKA